MPEILQQPITSLTKIAFDVGNSILSVAAIPYEPSKKITIKICYFKNLEFDRFEKQCVNVVHPESLFLGTNPTHQPVILPYYAIDIWSQNHDNIIQLDPL